VFEPRAGPRICLIYALEWHQRPINQALVLFATVYASVSSYIAWQLGFCGVFVRVLNFVGINQLSDKIKIVNGSRYYRALESVSIASALSIALVPFTHARSESINADSHKLQLLTARKKEWWPATADSLPQAVTCQL